MLTERVLCPLMITLAFAWTYGLVARKKGCSVGVMAVSDLWNLSRDVYRWVLSCDLLTTGYKKGSY